MHCFNFMLEVESAYQSIMALQGVWGDSGSVLPLHESIGSGLANRIAKSGIFYAEVKNVLLSCAFLPSCLVYAHTPLPPTPAGVAQESGEITVQLSNSSIQRSALVYRQIFLLKNKQNHPHFHLFF